MQRGHLGRIAEAKVGITQGVPGLSKRVHPGRTAEADLGGSQGVSGVQCRRCSGRATEVRASMGQGTPWKGYSGGQLDLRRGADQGVLGCSTQGLPW